MFTCNAKLFPVNFPFPLIHSELKKIIKFFPAKRYKLYSFTFNESIVQGREPVTLQIFPSSTSVEIT